MKMLDWLKQAGDANRRLLICAKSNWLTDGKEREMGKIEIYQGQSGDWYWHLKSANHQVVATGGEGYSERRHAYRAVKRVRALMRGKVDVAEVVKEKD